jgi:hypothetical protein
MLGFCGFSGHIAVGKTKEKSLQKIASLQEVARLSNRAAASGESHEKISRHALASGSDSIAGGNRG